MLARLRKPPIGGTAREKPMRTVEQSSDHACALHPPAHEPEPSEGDEDHLLAPGTCVPWGLVVIRRDGAIQFANKRAIAFMAAEDGLADRAGTLTVERAGIQRYLLALLSRIASGDPCGGEAVIGAPGRTGCPRYAIRLMPCEHKAAFGDGMVLAAISDLADGGCATRKTISLVFGLSEREAEFAEHFAAGMKVSDIAATMGVALNTARVHLRHVFIKTGTRGQIELARTFARLP